MEDDGVVNEDLQLEEIANNEDVEAELEESSEESSEIEEEFKVEIEGETSNDEEEEVALKKEPGWLKNLRKENRELKKKLKESSNNQSEQKEKVISLPAKPKLDDPEIDYDVDKFEIKLTEWHDKKRKVDEVEAEKANKIKEDQLAWETKVSKYNEGKGKLPVKDIDEIEDVVKSSLSIAQQSIIIQGASNPALLVYALGKNKATLARLAAIKNPIEFTWEISKLEDKLKTSKSKKPETLPEKTISGSGVKIQSSDSKLEKLRTEAEKTGNYTKVNAYKRELRGK